MGKGKGGGGGNDNAARQQAEARERAEAARRQQEADNRRRQDEENRRRQDEDNRRRQDEDNRRRQEEENRRRQDEENKRRQQDEVNRKAAEAKQRADAAQQQLRRDGGSQQARNDNGGGGQVQQAVAQVGNTLNRSDIRDLRQDGYSAKQIDKVASQVDKVGAGAQSLLDRTAGGGGGGNPGGNGGGSALTVRGGLDQVGDKLSRSEVKDLRQDGYRLQQVQKIADQVDKVGGGATRQLDRWQDSAAANPNGGSNGNRPSGGGSGGSAPAGGGAAGGERRDPEDRPAGAVSAGGAQGTSDRNGWLAAELNAIDTFRANTTPTVFNNYKPTDLSDQLRDAVSEANRFIDDNSSRSAGGFSSSASVTPTALRPVSLLDQDEYQRWGLGLVQ